MNFMASNDVNVEKAFFCKKCQKNVESFVLLSVRECIDVSPVSCADYSKVQCGPLA